MNRRSFLKVSGASVAITGFASAGIWLNSRSPTTALMPWGMAGQGYNDPRLNSLSYAILAPSPHNRQPWRVNLHGKHSLTLYCDLERRLPETDPYDRQILIGLGCFSELLLMAAKHLGFDVEVAFFPEGEPGARLDQRAIAEFTFRPGEAVTDPLFHHILQRRSTKESYNTQRHIPTDLFKELIDQPRTDGSVEVSQVRALNDLAKRSLAVEMSTPRTLRESVELMRIGKAEIQASPDGIDLSGAMMEVFKKIGMMDRHAMLDPQHSMNTTALTMFQDKFDSSMGYAWVKTTGNSRHAQLEAGRDYVRLNLKATALGLAMQPISQSLQEFIEMQPLFNEVHELLGTGVDERVQMLSRVGYAVKTVGASPRWPLDTVITLS